MPTPASPRGRSGGVAPYSDLVLSGGGSGRC
jgi:hypothetical protein